MAHNFEILRRIRLKSGLEMTQSKDFDILAESVKEKTGESLGVNTLKRVFGYKTRNVVARVSTLNIIARYLDYSDYESMIKDLGEDADISQFTSIDCIEAKDLDKGDRLKIKYDPNRVFLLTYLGDMKFLVDEAEGSKNIIKGDILTITQFVAGRRLIAVNVERNGKDLGGYEAAKYKGIESVEVIS